MVITERLFVLWRRLAIYSILAAPNNLCNDADVSISIAAVAVMGEEDTAQALPVRPDFPRTDEALTEREEKMMRRMAVKTHFMNEEGGREGGRH
jgi:hypothetical protein